VGAVSYPTLEHVAMEARVYPTRVLEGAETGLVLFAAAFLGHNDAIHFAETDMDVTCVDLDKDRLNEMRELYPGDWQWYAMDAWRFAESTSGKWDVVSADPWSGDFQRVADDVESLCKIANKAVVIGVGPETDVRVPSGWRVTETVERSSFRGGVSWLVLERHADA
jgi:hypothetical protein